MSSNAHRPGGGLERITVTRAFLTPKAKGQLEALFPEVSPEQLIQLVLEEATAERMADDVPWFIMIIGKARIVMAAQRGTDYKKGVMAITAVQEAWDKKRK